jgi:hypothetical protein
MKHLKYFEDYFLNEGQITNSDGVHPAFTLVEDIDGKKRQVNHEYLNLKQRISRYKKIKEIKDDSLGARGKDLFNKAIMDKPTEQLNVNIDSERLEYAWDYISGNLSKVLKDKKIEVNGVLIADNITQEGNNVVFNFTFKDKDSVQNTDPSGKTTKKILAGTITKGNIIEENTADNQVWLVCPRELKINNPTANNKKDIINNKLYFESQKLMFNIQGNYWYSKPQTGFWFTYKTPADISAKMLEDPNNKLYFDEPLLYKKLGIDPTTKKVVTPDPNVIIK